MTSKYVRPLHRDTPLRVLYLQPCVSFGGAERQAATVIPQLAASGVEVIPLVGPSGMISDWLGHRGVRGIILSPDFPGGGKPARGLARLRIPGQYVHARARVSEQVEGILRGHGIDLVFAAMPFSWLAATEPARRCGVPVVWRAGGTMSTRLSRMALRLWAASHAPDLLICNGQAVQQMFGPLVPAPSEVIYNGVDVDLFDRRRAIARVFRPRGARLVVGFAGRLTAQKRPQDFVEMALRLLRRFPDVQFLVAGEGPGRARYEEMAREAGPAVRFFGYVSDMPSFYAACDVLVLPSYSEGCPNVVLEAMAMERALVVSDVPATTEVVTHAREALVYPVGNVAALTDAVASLIEQPELRRKLAQAARERARHDFDAGMQTRRLALLLRAVVMQNAGRALPAVQPALSAARS